MALLGFKDRFVPLIESGAKRHTIRGIRADIKIGTRLDLYARPRQKGMRLIFRAPSVKVERIQVTPVYFGDGGSRAAIAIEGVWLEDDEREAFAVRDGFRDFDDMCEFWKVNRELPFEGCVIHWDFEKRTMEKRAT